MAKTWILVVLAALASAVLWWPMMIEPGIEFPLWLPLVLIALLAVSTTVLTNGRWLLALSASCLGTLVGLFSGILLFPSLDPIAGSYLPIVTAIAFAAAVLASLTGAFVGRKATEPAQGLRPIVWLMLTVCLCFGPVALSLTPPIVAKRIVHNERLAAQRVTSLQKAVVQTVAEMGDLASSCDGPAIKRHYSGPPFTEKDWRYIGGDYVQEDGYAIGIWCHDPKRFAIHALPVRPQETGVRQFCSDQAGALGCGLDVDAFHVACIPCPR